MKNVTIYHNPRCSKCREAMCLLEDQSPEVREYLEKRPTEEELRGLLAILDGEPRDLVRTKEEAFQREPFALDDVGTVARELARRPELLERPIVVAGGRAIVARPPEKLIPFLNSVASR